jgi:hypothetical protein
MTLATASPVVCLLSGGERTLRVTDKDLAQADPLLRCTCSWSAADGLWRVAGTPQPRTSLYMWLTAGLSGMWPLTAARSYIMMCFQPQLRRQTVLHLLETSKFHL